MKYYDSKGNLKEFNTTEPFNHGTYADVFKIENDTQVLKKYKDPLLQTKWKIDYETFEALKDIDDFHFIHLLERYYDYSKYGDDSIECIIEWPDWNLIDAYTYDYIEEEYINLIEMPVDYVLTNLEEIEKLFDYFARKGIKVGDLTTGNVILNANGIVIIDPDYFNIHKLSDECTYEKIQRVNKAWLCDLFKCLLNKERYYEKISRLFNERELLQGDSIVSGVAKKIGTYPKLIDYARSR